jgi:arylsulfatase A-like enzyme
MIHPCKTLLALCGLLVAGSAGSRAAAAADKPMNVIFILADDLGWSDTTLYGGTTYYKTPNVERLAKRGMTFTRGYSASPLCSPTRASVLTGQTPARTGITAPVCHEKEERLTAELRPKTNPGFKAIETASATRLSTDLPTLGKLMKASGRATAHFGKWHLGPEPFSPLQQGFDVDIPHHPGPGPAGSYVAPWKFPDFKEKTPDEHIEDRMAMEAVAWMKTAAKKGPFYMNYWMFSVHAPFDAKAALIEKYKATADPANPQHCPTYAAMVHSMDDAIGTLLDAVDALGIADRTAIIFTADNGGNMYNDVDGATPTSNAPLRGGKATVFEGGIRVPLVVVWPGIAKPGSRSGVIVQSTDYYPTLLGLLGIERPANHPLDGTDIAPALRGQKMERPPIFTYFPHAPGVPDWLPPAAAVHVGDWKLIRTFHQGENGAHAYYLYNLKDDLGEKNNLAASNPERVKEMDALIGKYLADAKTVVPKANPDFNPAQYHPEEIGVQKEKKAAGKAKKTAANAAGKSAPSSGGGGAAAGGWKTDKPGFRMEVAGGALRIVYDSPDPFLVAAEVPELTGPVRLEMDLLSGPGGLYQLRAAREGRGYIKGDYTDLPVTSMDEAQRLSIDLPGEGRVNGLRIDLPGHQGEVVLKAIRVYRADKSLAKEWRFE